MAYSNNGGASWSAPINVDITADDQFYPSIATDSSTQTISIAYLNNHIDPLFQHRYLINLAQIPPNPLNPAGPFPSIAITSTPDDPSSDSGGLRIMELGDTIGLSVRGTGVAGASRIYAGYTYHLRPGTYNGTSGPQGDDYLTRLTY